MEEPTVAWCAFQRRTSPQFSRVPSSAYTAGSQFFSRHSAGVVRRDALVYKGNVTRYGRENSTIPLFCVRDR